MNVIERARAWSIVVCLLAAVSGAHAQAAGDTLTGNDFKIDLVTGPVIGTGRIIGLGGAYTAIALGGDGASWTPAAYATRSLWELDWFEWDLVFDYSPSLFRNTDFDNNGKSGVRYENLLFTTVGGRFQLGEIGFGAILRLQDYDLGPRANLTLLTAQYGAAYALLEGQLMVGIGARTAVLTIDERSTSKTLVDFDGTGPELGAVLGPAGKPYRIGAAARLAVESTKVESTRVAAGLTLPRSLVLPSELQIGLAYQLGARPLNRRFENPHDVEKALTEAMLARRMQRQRAQSAREAQAERLRASLETGPPLARQPALADPAAFATPRDPEWWVEESQQRWAEERALLGELEAALLARAAQVDALPREYLLLAADVIFTGTTDNGVGLESFLTQERQASGKHVSVGVRVGAEGEPVQGRWKVRLGSYLEPSRFAHVPHRVHGTLSTDVRLFRWDIFGLLEPFELRIGSSLDVAARYYNFGLGLGVWH